MGAKLVEITPLPTPQDILPYTQSLVTHLYETDKGSIQVTHWAILDRKAVPQIQGLQKGKKYKLTLQSMASQGHLQSEKNDNLLSDFGSDEYLSVKPPVLTN